MRPNSDYQAKIAHYQVPVLTRIEGRLAPDK